MKIKYLLNGLTDKFYPKELLNLNIEEKKATCDNCIQAPKTYKADLKCCTFWPFIPNYVVGAILSSPKERHLRVQSFIRELIKNNAFVLPIGIPAPPWYQKEFKKNKKRIFGKQEEFLCPYYEKSQNQCSIWEYRGSVCTSFYCESSYGVQGQEFWKSLENYMSYLEMGVAEEVLVYHDYSPRDMNSQLEFLDIEVGNDQFTASKKMTSQEAKKYWKHYYADKEAFYVKSYEFVQKLTSQQRSEILGELGTNLLRNLESASERL